jgi:transposase InsO family protein
VLPVGKVRARLNRVFCATGPIGGVADVLSAPRSQRLRGVQYACTEYTETLAAYDIQPSMSRVGNPYDNAKAESFMKTLKQKEINESSYPTCAKPQAPSADLYRNRVQPPAAPFGSGLSSPQKISLMLLRTPGERNQCH